METPSNTTPDPAEQSLCRVQNRPWYGIAGRLPDGTQMFMRVAFSEVYVVKFNREGDFLSVERYALSDILPEGQDYHAMQRDDKLEAVEQWAANFGFTTGEIFVKELSGTESGFEIKLKEFGWNYIIMVSPVRDAPDPAEERLYRIHSRHLGDKDYFMVGRLKDGTQVFLSPSWPDVVAIKFDSEGNFLSEEYIPMWAILPTARTDHDEDRYFGWWYQMMNEMAKWAASVGITEEPIAVKKFASEDSGIAIRDHDIYLQEKIDNGEELDDDEKESIEEQQYMQTYVLVCGNELGMYEEGDVHST
jgi:hypothetical protein